MAAPRALLIVIVVFLSSSGTLAQQAPPPLDAKKAPAAEKKAAPPPGEVGAPAAGGFVVFIDPVTGKIRQPDAAEIGRLVAPPAAAKPLVEKPLLMKIGPGGAVGVVLDSRFENYVVVTKTPDGHLVMDCVTGEKKADGAVAEAAGGPARSHDKVAADVR